MNNIPQRKLEFYTDGAFSSKSQMGGWAAICLENDMIIDERSGYEPYSTNNRMELLAVIQGLEALKEPCEVNLYSDSQYVINAINEKWLENWSNSGWRGSSKKGVKNVDLWQALIPLITMHKVNFIKVKGHSDNEYNNRCDKIAVGIYKNKK